MPTAADPKAGEKTFKNYCAACHHPEGLGTHPTAAAPVPPLLGSEWVTGPEGRIVRIVLHGVRGSIKVADRSYDLEMPGFGQILADAQVASLLSFVRQRYGGNAPPIDAATVKRIRAETRDRNGYWTAEDLLAVR